MRQDSHKSTKPATSRESAHMSSDQTSTTRQDKPDTPADRLARWIILGGVIVAIAYIFIDAFIKGWTS